MVDDKTKARLSHNLCAEPDDFMHSFRKNLFMYVDEKDITLADIAEEAEIPMSTLKSFLYGDSADCRLSLAVKLAKALGVSVDELVGAGTLPKQTCESLQLMRRLPGSFTHFVRWATRYHYELLMSQKVTEKAIEVMRARCAGGGDMEMTNDFEVIDISDQDDAMRTKVFMGIRMPCNDYCPKYFEDSILLLANDRPARPGEHAVVSTGQFMWIVRCEFDGFYFLTDDRKDGKPVSFDQVVGYVAKVIEK